MSFFNLKPPKKSVKLVLAGGHKVGKTTLLIEASKSSIFGPLLLIDTQQGSNYYRSNLAPGSEVVDALDLVDMNGITSKLFKNRDKLPFNCVAVDDLTTYWARLVGVYDDKKSPTRDIEYEKQIFDEKRRALHEWGDIKTQYFKTMRRLNDLPCHIIFTSWISDVFKKDSGGNLVVTGELRAKIEKATNYFVDAAIQMYQDEGSVRRFKIQYSRSKVLKDGDIANIQNLEKMVKVLEEDSSEKNNKEIAESIGDHEEPEQTEISEKCESCGGAVSKAIATATRKQTNGKTLCLNCLKKVG